MFKTQHIHKQTIHILQKHIKGKLIYNNYNLQNYLPNKKKKKL
jgi:hypothetical protein